MGEYVDGRMDGWVSMWVDGWLSAWMGDRIVGQMCQRALKGSTSHRHPCPSPGQLPFRRHDSLLKGSPLPLWLP